MRQLSSQSSLAKALNDGIAPLSHTDNFLADLWSLWAKKDHPTRAKLLAKARAEQKHLRMLKKQATFEKRKRRYGLG